MSDEVKERTMLLLESMIGYFDDAAATVEKDDADCGDSIESYCWNQPPCQTKTTSEVDFCPSCLRLIAESLRTRLSSALTPVSAADESAEAIATKIADGLDLQSDAPGVRYKLVQRVQCVELETDFRDRNYWTRETFIEEVRAILKQS